MTDVPIQETVLIVDDMPANIKTVAAYLKDQGLRIMTALTGEDALEKAVRLKPDIILLDVMMPGIDGFETCRRLKAIPSIADVPVIFMTSLSEEEHKVAGFAAGAVDYVTKPLYQDEVLARVTTHLRLHTLTQTLQQANKQLTELNATKDKFFSIIAHDLREPFGPLLGFLEIVKATSGSSSDAEIQESVSLALQSAKKVHKLLENLLQWSQLERGLMPYNPKTIDLQDLIAQIIDLFTETATKKNIRIINNLDQQILVYSDGNMLGTVLRNLVSNALKFTPTNGHIVISARQNDLQSGNAIEISVKDTGMGIKQDNLEKLFSLQSQHITEGTAQEKGTGLGLILCREIAEKNGGQIWIESDEGKGTTVRFTVPMVP